MNDLKIEPLSPEWQVLSEHMQKLLGADCKALETAVGDRTIITLQARVALLRGLLDLPKKGRPAPVRPLGFETK